MYSLFSFTTERFVVYQLCIWPLFQLLRGSYHTVNSLGYTTDKCILMVGDQVLHISKPAKQQTRIQKPHNETTQELEALRNKQHNESNRRYGDSFYLSEIEDTLSKILEVTDSKTIPGDLVKKLRWVPFILFFELIKFFALKIEHCSGWFTSIPSNWLAPVMTVQKRAFKSSITLPLTGSWNAVIKCFH